MSLWLQENPAVWSIEGWLQVATVAMWWLKPNCKLNPYESSETIIILLFVLSEALKRSWDGSCQTLPCCEFHLNFDEENLNIMEQSWNRVTFGPPLAGTRAADIWCEKQNFGTENDMKCLDVSRTVIKVVFISFPFPSASLAFLTHCRVWLVLRRKGFTANQDTCGVSCGVLGRKCVA